MKKIDIFDLGKNTFNSCYSQLKNDKKILYIYSQNIENYLDCVEENKNMLQKIKRDIEKNSSGDKPFFFLKKFEIILNLNCNAFDYFLENSQKLFEHLKECVVINLTFISNFLAKTQESATNIKNKSEIFFKNYNKAIKSLEEIEKYIIDDYIKDVYKIQINKNKTKVHSTEELVAQSNNDEKEFLKSKEHMKNLFKNFMEEYNLNMKEIKTKMTSLNEDCKNDLLNIIKVVKDCCNNLINLSNDNIEKIENYEINNKNFKEEYSEYLNNEIKENELFEVLDNNKYNMKIIKEKEKNSIEINIFKPKDKNESKQNLYITAPDIYNIVEKFYSYNFQIINKEEYILEEEKQKLEITKIMSKFLGYDFYKIEIKKPEPISKDEINNFVNLIFSKNAYLIEFLSLLNNYRTTGKYELSFDIFEIIKIIFRKAADYLLVNPCKEIYNHMIILSQTFYVMKNNKNKYFLQKELKDKEFFTSVDFWYNKIDNLINDELERFENELDKNEIEINETKKTRKKEEILFTNFVSFITSINGFELEKEKVDKIIFPLMDKYNIKENRRNSILGLINVYKNDIK